MNSNVACYEMMSSTVAPNIFSKSRGYKSPTGQYLNKYIRRLYTGCPRNTGDRLVTEHSDNNNMCLVKVS